MGGKYNAGEGGGVRGSEEVGNEHTRNGGETWKQAPIASASRQ